MKLQSLKLFVATLVIGIFAVNSAFAQQSLDFEIPFDFQIGKTQMKAGKYKIKKMKNKTFSLTDVEKNKSTLFLTTAQVGNERSVKTENIVFHRYGNSYFLREIYVLRATVGDEIGETKAERIVRKEYEKAYPKLVKNKTEKVSVNSTQ